MRTCSEARPRSPGSTRSFRAVRTWWRGRAPTTTTCIVVTPCLQSLWIPRSDLLVPRSQGLSLTRERPQLTTASRADGHGLAVCKIASGPCPFSRRRLSSAAKAATSPRNLVTASEPGRTRPDHSAPAVPRADGVVRQSRSNGRADGGRNRAYAARCGTRLSLAAEVCGMRTRGHLREPGIEVWLEPQLPRDSSLWIEQ